MVSKIAWAVGVSAILIAAGCQSSQASRASGMSSDQVIKFEGCGQELTAKRTPNGEVLLICPITGDKMVMMRGANGQMMMKCPETGNTLMIEQTADNKLKMKCPGGSGDMAAKCPACNGELMVRKMPDGKMKLTCTGCRREIQLNPTPTGRMIMMM